MTGGSVLYDGLEYQALVSVLAAIDTVIVGGHATALELEPASDEDLEAAIARPLADDEPCIVETGGDIDQGYRLIVQSKRRDTGTWSAASFDRLLKHGGPQRASAASRLKADQKVRYLLATSGALTLGAEALRTKTFLDWPQATKVGTRFDAYSEAGESRVAILGGLTGEQIHARLLETLRVSLSVPHTRLDDCIAALIQEALKRGSAKHSGLWTREEIAAVLKAHDAIMPGALRDDDFVPPLDYVLIQARLRSERAILLTGPSGTGKTSVALRLRNELIRAHPGHTRVDLTIADGPQALSRALEAAPAIIYIEDPWGPVALAPDAAAWTKALKDVLPRLPPDVWLAITSRTDILQSAGVDPAAFAPWRIELEAANYGETERERLFDLRAARMSAPLQRLVRRQKAEVVAALSLPLEIDRYFGQFRLGPLLDEHERTFLRRVLEGAGQDTYADVVADQVRARQDQFWGVVLKLLLQGAKTVSRPWLRSLRRGASERAAHRSGSLDTLIAFLASGHSLEWTDDRVGYAHPKVGAGLGKIAADDPGLVEDALLFVLQVLTDEARPGLPAGGVAFAARILVGHLPEDPAKAEDALSLVDPAIRAQLDHHLTTVLQTLDGRAFRDALFASARIGSPNSLLFELARWLTAGNKVDRTDFASLMRWWTPPERPQAWFDEVGQQPWARRVLETFIETVIGHEHHFYSKVLAIELARFGLDLAPSFTRLAVRIAGHSYDDTIEVATQGGLTDLDGFVPAVRAAIAARGDAVPEGRTGWSLTLANGEYDDESAEQYEGPEGENYCANEILSDFAKAMRNGRGWRDLDAFEGAEDLFYGWLWVIGRDSDPKFCENELRALLARADTDEKQAAFWWLVCEHPAIDLADLALEQLAAGPSERVQHPLHQVIAGRRPEALIALQASDITEARADAALLRLRDLSLGRYSRIPEAQDVTPIRDDLIAALPSALQPLGRAVAAPLSEAADASDSAATSAAQDVFTTDGQLSARLLRFTKAAHPRFDELYAAALDAWTPSDIEAAPAALDVAIDCNRDDLIRSALTHPLAALRRTAMLALGQTLTKDEATKLSRDESYFVRRALFGVLSTRQSAADADLLVELCRDPFHAPYTGQGDYYPNASSAAEALNQVATLSDPVLARLKRLLGKLKDPVTRRIILAILARRSPAFRTEALTVAFNPDRVGAQNLLATALLDTIDLVTPPELDAITTERLLRLSARAAVTFSRILAQSGDDQRVLAVAESLSRSQERRSLLLLLGGPRPSAQRQTGLAELLPKGHPAAEKIRTLTGTPMAYDAIDDLGEAEITERVRDLLSGWFAPPPG